MPGLKSGRIQEKFPLPLLSLCLHDPTCTYRGGRGILVGVCPKPRNFGLSGLEAEGVKDHTWILCPEVSFREQQQKGPVRCFDLPSLQDLLFTSLHQETIIAPALISFVPENGLEDVFVATSCIYPFECHESI
jgi:hypothetical protein